MLRNTLFFLTLCCFFFIALLAYFVANSSRSPREIASYIDSKASNNSSIIDGFGSSVSKTLRALDRMAPFAANLPALTLGVQAGDVSVLRSPVVKSAGNTIQVSSADQARIAIVNANPGDVIIFSPGMYQFSGDNISATKAGRENARIVVRAEVPGSVKLKLSLSEGFHVSAPYWTFENLHLQGNCKEQSNCDHAFHVVGNAHHFVARNNTIVDFNAHFKVNMVDRKTPDDGVIEYNSISNSEVRRTEKSVTLVDLVAASRWRIEHNFIADFVKGGSDRISYGAFVKGGGRENRIVNNLVVCEYHLRGEAGQRVGLSLGGGGTGKDYCRDHQCVTEQDRGVIESNLIMACSDDGIYLNKAAASRIISNTLIDTGGIDVRFGESTADVEGNLVDGKIRSRDGGLIRERDNLDTNMLSLFSGYHPVRNMFKEPNMLDLSWRKRPALMSFSDMKGKGLCGEINKPASVIGAFDDFNSCLLTNINKPR